MTREGGISQLTVDHSLAQALVEANTITAAEAKDHRFKNVLWKYLGSKEVGEGSLEITELQAPHRVAMRLDFIKPFEAHNQAEFRIEALPGGASQVSWSMTGPSPFVSKLMGVIFNMDRMIGRDFEAGLHKLKALAEPAPATPAN